MHRRVRWGLMFTAAIAVTAVYVGKAVATPSDGFTGTTLALGRFGGMDAFNYSLVPPGDSPDGQKVSLWLSEQKTMGSSDVYVQNNVWAPGGSTGWHTHPGHSLIIVTAGTVTTYDGSDVECKPTVYTQGMGFVDPGGDHVHLIRNEGTVEARTVAVQVIPAGAVRRVDAANPGACPF